MNSRLSTRMSALRLGLAALLLIGSVFSKSPLAAQNRPVAVPTGRAGYKLELSTHWPSNDRGIYYFPFKLSRDPLTPAPTDEVFTITIETSEIFSGIGQASFSKQVTIPLGSNSVSGEVPIQAELLTASRFRFLGSNIRVERGPGDGRFSRNDMILDQVFLPITAMFTGDQTSMYLTSGYQDPGPSTTLYFWDGMLNRQFNQTGGLAWNRNAMVPPTPVSNPVLLGGSFATEEWVAIGLKSLPDSWEGMGMINEVLVDIGDLKTLCKNETSRNVLESWVASGGHLIVAGRANNLNHTQEILSVLCGPERFSNRSNRRWKHYSEQAEVKGKFELPKISAINVTESDQLRGVDMLVQGYATGAILSVKNVGDQKRDQRSYDKLQLVLSKLDSPSVPAIRNPQWRAPMSPIPGVGTPPFGLFIGFLFGFLFLIGPAMIYYIRRTKARTQYLFFLVPILSFFTCVAILGYSYLVDFAKQSGRIRSVTVLQPETGMAYHQSMMAYYCGDQPSGYEYDPGIVAFTEISETDDFHMQSAEDGSMRMTSTRIAPRKLHFVFAHTAHQTDQRLKIGNENGGAPQVENRLNTKIKLLLFRVNNTIYTLENLDDGQVGVGKPANFELLKDKLIDVFPDFRPQASVFSRAYPAFFDSGYVGSFRQKVQSGFQVNKLTNVLKADRDFVAFTAEDPTSIPLRAPFDYRLRNHIIYGKH